MNRMFAECYKIRDQQALHFLTFTIVGWIDIFSRKLYRDIMLDSFTYCRLNKGLRIGAYVIMSNHTHVIWQTNNNLSDIIRDFKTFTSKAITNAIRKEPESRRDWLLYMFNFHANNTNQNDTSKVWTNNNHPEEIYTEDFMKSKLFYTHNNPVRAGLVTEPEYYLYSSASNYITGKGLIEIDFLY